jgi:hypothetical protein
MESKLNELKDAMDSTTHKGLHFTEFQKNKIRNAVHTSSTVKTKSPNKFVIFLMTTFAICLIGFFVSTGFLIKQNETINVIRRSRKSYSASFLTLNFMRESLMAIFSVSRSPLISLKKKNSPFWRFTRKLVNVLKYYLLKK